MAVGSLFGAVAQERPKAGGSCPVEPLWTLRQGRQLIEAQLWNHGKYGVEARLLRDGELVSGRRFDTWKLAEQFLEIERRDLEQEGWISAPAATETDQLVRLVTSQDALADSWLKHLVTIEAGMMLVVGFLVRPADPGRALDPRLQVLVGLVVPLLGIALAVAIGNFVLVQRRWASWYIERIKNPKLSPTIMPGPGDIRRQGAGRTGRAAIGLVVLLVLGWVGVVVLLRPWVAWSELYRFTFPF